MPRTLLAQLPPALTPKVSPAALAETASTLRLKKEPLRVFAAASTPLPPLGPLPAATRCSRGCRKRGCDRLLGPPSVPPAAADTSPLAVATRHPGWRCWLRSTRRRHMRHIRRIQVIRHIRLIRRVQHNPQQPHLRRQAHRLRHRGQRPQSPHQHRPRRLHDQRQLRQHRPPHRQ